MRRPPPALRHVITHRVAFGAVILTTLITAAFTAAAVSFVSAITAGAARSELSGKPGSAIVVTASVSPGNVRAADTRVADMITGRSGHGTGAQIPATVKVSLQSDVLDLPRHISGDAPGDPHSRPQTQLISMPGLATHVALLSGSCRGGSGRIVLACVPKVAAQALGLSVGEHLTLRDAVSGKPLRVDITGIFRPLLPASPYWLMSPISPDSVRRSSAYTFAGPLVTTPAVASAGHFTVTSAAWLGVPDFSRLTGGNLASIGNELAGRINALPNSNIVVGSIIPDASVTTNLPAELTAVSTALVVTRTQLLAGMLTLLVVAGATLSLAVRMLAQRREAEAALLAARGASRMQLARRGLLDAVAIAALALVGGPLIGTAVAPLLIRSSGAAGTAIGPWPAPATWIVTAGVAVGCIAIIALPWLRRPPSPLRRRASRGRQRSVTAAVYARADLAVVVVAAGAAWQLTHSSGPVSTGLDGTLSADPILVAAPVLALTAGALLTLRALPLAARLGDRLAARGRGLAMPYAAWQISRQTLRRTGPTLVAVLAVAAAVMAIAQRESWHRSVQAQASFQVGADQRVLLPSAAPLAIGQVSRITKAPGVTASTPAVRATFNLPNGSVATLLAVNTSAASSIIPADAAGPARATLHQLAAAVPGYGTAIPGRPAALRLTATLGPASLAQPQLFVQLTDAAGIGYQLLAGNLPADGKPHAMTVSFGPGAHIDYPLRITGFSLQFTTPVARQPVETLAVSSVRALASARSATGTSVRAAVPGSLLRFSAIDNPGARNPSAVRLSVSADGAVVAAFKSGYSGQHGRAGTGITVSDSYPAGRPLPAIVTRSYLAATGLRIGQHAQVQINNVPVNVTLAAAVANIPTIAGGSSGVLVDQRALTDELLATGSLPPTVTEWWLRTGRHPVLAGLPPGTTVSSRVAVAAALAADPLTVASQEGLLGIAIAAILLALIGLLVSVATASERSRDVALLDALGVPPGRVARLLSLEQALTAVTTCAIGVLFGVVLSELIIPAVTLTPHATKPVPAIAVSLPWTLAALIALAMAVVPTLAVALTLPRSASVVARIRLEDET